MTATCVNNMGNGLKIKRTCTNVPNANVKLKKTVDVPICYALCATMNGVGPVDLGVRKMIFPDGYISFVSITLR